MRSKRSCFPLAILASLLCLGVMILGALSLNIPTRVEAKLGPPNPNLSPWRRFLYAAVLYWQQEDLTRPVDPGGQERMFEVQMGESAPSVIGRLWQEGLIPEPGAFRTFLTYAGLDTTLQAGRYQLSPAMSPVEIAHALQDATPSEVSFNVLPGWRAEEIAALLPTSGFDITPGAFLSAVRIAYPNYSFSDQLPSPPSVEGFIFPGEYVLPRDFNARKLIRHLLDTFETQVSAEIRQGFERQGLTLFEAVTLASLVEREAIVDDEMPLIASVFLNRWRIGMKLDADPTVQYAVGYNEEKSTWWTNPLSLEDLAIDSPYNTYRYAGLPPGPIANPSLNALNAVAFPARTQYLYFRAGCEDNGRHLFAKTYEEHIQNECR